MRNGLLNEIKEYIKELKIPGINQSLKTRIEEAYRLDISYEELLRDLFRDAYDVRKENGKKNRIKNANFPYKKYLEDLKTEYLSEEARKKLKELKTLKFIEEGKISYLLGIRKQGKHIFQ